jgi:hypothetical protein
LVVEIDENPIVTPEDRARRERFARNWKWFDAHASEIYARHRGKCYCVAGQQLFVADDPTEAIAMAKAAFPDDDGLLTGIIPLERAARIYAYRRRLASVR